MHPFLSRLTLAILLVAGVKQQQLIFLTNSSSTTADAFGMVQLPAPRRSSTTRQWSSVHDHSIVELGVPQQLSRTQFMVGLLPVLLGSVVPTAARAAEDLKGTKKDPAYEACLSQCMYTCTKPKGEEQKSRTVCLSECKVQCATTKQQLMLGTPLSSP